MKVTKNYLAELIKEELSEISRRPGERNVTPEPSAADMQKVDMSSASSRMTRGQEDAVKYDEQSKNSFLLVRTPQGSVFGKGVEDLIANYAGLVGLGEDEELELYDAKKDKVIGTLVVQGGKASVKLSDKPHKFKPTGAAKLGDDDLDESDKWTSVKENKMKITESRLKELVKEEMDKMCQDENMDEAFGDFARSLAGQAGKAVASKAKQVGSAVADKAKQVGTAVGGAVKQAKIASVKADVKSTAQKAAASMQQVDSLISELSGRMAKLGLAAEASSTLNPVLSALQAAKAELEKLSQ